jgi:hypothetical protein
MSILSSTKTGKAGIDEMLERFGLDASKAVMNIDGTIDYEGDILINPLLCGRIWGSVSDCLPQINVLHGSLSITNGVTSLKGMPRVVDGNVSIAYCSTLCSLHGCPEEVTGDFKCSHCTNLTSLDGVCKSIGHCISLNDCALTSLEGLQSHVYGDLYVHNNQLTSLAGAPEVVDGTFCADCNLLSSYVGGPKSVGYALQLNGNSLTTFEGFPEEVPDTCDVSDNLISCFDYAPERVGGNWLISFNNFPDSAYESIDTKVGGRVVMTWGSNTIKTSKMLKMSKLVSSRTGCAKGDCVIVPKTAECIAN